MSIQFHELPPGIFEEKTRPYISRLNRELRDLFGLEGVMRTPVSSKRSDASISRREDPRVDISRVTPSITSVVSGSSTVVGTPNLDFGLNNTVGSTSTAISVDSAIALFGTQAALALTGTSTAGTSAFSARADHRHEYTELLAAASDRSLTLTLTDDATNGAQLEPSGAFSQNLISLKSGWGTNAFQFSASAGSMTNGDFAAIKYARGFVMLDDQATVGLDTDPHYWRHRMSARAIPYITDMGITPP